MDESSGFCNICYEPYDDKEKIPKQMKCCKKLICLECLKDIYENRKSDACPMCRNKGRVDPETLLTSTIQLNRLIVCPNCTREVLKTQLHYSFETKNLKCSECHDGDLTLSQYIQQIILDDINCLTSNFKKLNNTILLDELTSKINSKLDIFFEKVKQKVIIKIKKKIIKEINDKFGYDLNSGESPVEKELKKLEQCVNGLSLFVKDPADPSISIPLVLNDINNYSTQKDNIDVLNYNLTYMQLFIQENKLFELKKDIKDDELSTFFLNVFETVLSDHHVDTLAMTGIKFFDKNYRKANTNLAPNDNQIKQKITRYNSNVNSTKERHRLNGLFELRATKALNEMNNNKELPPLKKKVDEKVNKEIVKQLNK